MDRSVHIIIIRNVPGANNLAQTVTSAEVQVRRVIPFRSGIARARARGREAPTALAIERKPDLSPDTWSGQLIFAQTPPARSDCYMTTVNYSYFSAAFGGSAGESRVWVTRWVVTLCFQAATPPLNFRYAPRMPDACVLLQRRRQRCGP